MREDAKRRRGERSEAMEQRLDRAEDAVAVWLEKQSGIRTYMLKRIIKAFPSFSLYEHEESLSDLRNYIETHWNGPRN